jgi:phage-related protein
MTGQVVAEGVVVVEADASGVAPKIAREVEGGARAVEPAGRSIGRSIFGGVVAGYAAVGGTQAIVGYFGSAISGASDLNETLSKSNVIFGSNGGAISKWGDAAAQTLGLSKEQAVAAAAGFGDMFSQIGFAQSEAAKMSTAVVQMSADLGSFNNLPTADVADRISAAFRGEYDSLQAVIPNINAARVESEALAATGKKTAAELTAQDKATAVLAIVNKDGARAMGDFARTSDGAANSAKIASAALTDQSTRLGGVLLPMWTQFLSFVNTQVVPAFSATVTWISENSEMLGGLVKAVAAAGAAYVVLRGGMMLYNGVMSAIKIGQAIYTASTYGMTGATYALNTAMKANPIGLVLGLLAALVGAIVWVATETTFFQDAWTNVTNVIGTAWNWLWTTVLKPVFDAIGAVFTWLYQNVITPIVTGIMVYIGLWAAVITWLWQTVVSPVFAAIGAIFNWIWQSVIQPVANFIRLKMNELGLVFRVVYATFIKPAFDAIGAVFRWVWTSIIQPVANFIGGAIRNIGNVVRSVFGGIAGFMGAAFQGALNVIRGPINGIIGLVNQAILGLNSLRVTIPDWVPVVGGQTWGLSIPTIPMLAKGGNIIGGGSVLVGERGPEILNLPRGASVVPLTSDQRSGGSGDGKKADVIIEHVEVHEAEDPLGTPGRVAAEIRRFRGGR